MHIFVLFCLAFLLGCLCSFKFAAVDIIFILMMFLFVFAVKLVIFKIKTVANMYVVLLVLIFCCGTAAGLYHDYKTFKNTEGLYGTELTLTGRAAVVQKNGFVMESEYGRFRIYNYGGEYVEKNQLVSVCGEAMEYPVAAYRGGFDSRLYNALHGIVGYMFAENVTVNEYDESFSLWDIGDNIRNLIETRVRMFPDSENTKGFVTALLTGNTDYMDDELKEAFRLTGISHLTAVSGLHVGIFLSFFLLFSGRMRKNRFVHILFVLTMVVMYTVIIGERASVFRAGIMSVAGYVMFAAKRRSDSMMNLMAAGLLICFVNPYYVADPGFLMSFLATFGIVLFSECFSNKIWTVPLIAWLFMMPITVYYFNTVSLEAVLVNIIAVPLVPPIIFFGYAGCVFPLFSIISCGIADIIIAVAEFFASFGSLHITLPSPSAVHFIIWGMLVCAVYILFNYRSFEKSMIMLMCAFIVFASWSSSERGRSEGVSVRFINNGNYNMQHITTENDMQVFLDCGTYANDYAVKSGTNEIYMVIITRGKSSCFEGLEELCSKQEVRYALLPEDMKNIDLELEKTEIMYYNQNDYCFNIDGIDFRFTERNGERCFLTKVYDDIIAVPLGKTVADMGKYTVMCVPDKCTDCAKAVQESAAEYYIHPTCRYNYYDFGHKYITSQQGMVRMIFNQKTEPELYIY